MIAAKPMQAIFSSFASRWMPAQREIQVENERHERYAHSIDSGDVRTL